MATTYTLISSVTVGSGGAADIEFTSIPATYTDLLVSLSLRSSRSGTTDDDLGLTINAVTTNRTWRLLFGTGSSAGSDNGTNTLAGTISASNATSSTFGNAQIYFPNYAGSSNKSFSSDSVFENNATAAKVFLMAGLWSSSAAITSLKFNAVNGNLVQYSTAYLYGISNA
jgi:hypothetical protein